MTAPEESGRNRRWPRRLLRECLKYRRLAILTAVGTLAAVAADLVTPLLARAAIDHATGHRPAAVGLTVLVVFLLTAAVLRYGAQFGRRFSAGKLAIYVQDNLRRALLETLLHLDGHAQDGIRTGQVVSRSITDLQVVQRLLAMAPMALGGAVQVVLAVGIMLWLSPLLTLVALLVIPLVAVAAYRGRKRLFAATWSAQQAAGDVAGHVEETVTGVRVVKGFNQERRATAELSHLSELLYGLQMRAARLSARFTPTMSAIPQFGMVLVIGVGGLLALRGEISAGTFLAFSTYIGTMTSLARILTNLVVASQLAASSATRVFDVIDHPRDAAYDTGADDALPAGPLGVRLRDVDFSYGSRPVLNGIELTVEPGECVAVVGGPGSGKSTLGALVTGRYRPTAGTVELVGERGTADVTRLAPDVLAEAVIPAFDEPFLYSDTVSANIALGPEPVALADPERIRAAARRAAAKDFVTALDAGFDEVVGERGLTLSGGQRQRIALARAFYARPRVLVLDDATSAVDAVTETRILAHLRSAETTMLVLAHRRSTLGIADRVAVLDDGRIVDAGTAAELDARCARFRELMSPPDSATGDSPAQRAAAAQESLGVDALWRDAPPAADSGSLGRVAADPALAAAIDSLGPASERPGVDLDDAAAERDGFSLRQILQPVRWALAILLATVGLDTLISLAYPPLAQAVLDAGTHHHGDVLWTATATGLALVVAAWVVGAVHTVVAARTGERVLYTLRVRSYAHLQRLGLDYYERQLSGRIMTRMTTDVDALSSFLQDGLSTAVIALLTVAGVSVALLITDWRLGLVLAVVLPLLAAATVWFRRVARTAHTVARERISLVNADFQENLAGIATTRAYRHAEVAGARFAELSDDWVTARVRAQRAIALYFPFITFCADATAAVAVGYGAHLIAGGALSPGTLVAFLMYLALLFGPVQQVSTLFDEYQQAAVGLNRISDLLATPGSVLEADRPAPLPPASGPADVRLDHVRFRYSGAASDALHDVDLHVPAGTSLALVGATGAGKSTVVKLLARFYDPTSGTVRFNDADIAAVSLRDYRSHLGVVPQEPHLFAGTVADNIAYGRPAATREEIVRAAHRVGAAGMIAALPGGMNFPVAERGRGLSSGQRQLIALARAELVEPDLILLDEATATLDQATEAQVLLAGEALARRRTSVIVAHRLATAARADTIAVVDGGRIVEHGSHDALLAAGGRYAQLWTAGLAPDEAGVAESTTQARK
ncbi:MAG: ABC transporter ATP-binding protein [Gordonia sp. (in: high G+C Gram-positive bacteria)]